MVLKKSLVTNMLGVMLLMAGVVMVSCGGDDEEDEDESSGFFPSLDFQLPSTVSSNLIQNEDSKTVIERWGARLDATVDKINSMLARLNSDKIKEAGEFTGKGPSQNISGSVTTLSSGDYDWEAVVCLDDEPFKRVRWSEDGSKVNVVRDLSKRPLAETDGTDLWVEVTYTEGTSTTLEFWASGEPWRVPAVISDEDALQEYISATKSSDGDFGMTGVNGWYQSDDSPATVSATGYLVGELAADGSGQFVAYRSFNEILCAGTFSETNASDPGWCLGRKIGASSRFTDEERATAWGELDDNLSVSSQTNLRAVTWGTTPTCP